MSKPDEYDLYDDDDFDYRDDDFCDCEEYDADPIEGRAMCLRCGRSWWLTDEQMKAELRFQAEYAEQMQEEAEGRSNA